MPQQPLTDAQTRIIQQLTQDHQTPAFCVEIVEAAMRFRNASAPRSVTRTAEAQADLFAAIDKVS